MAIGFIFVVIGVVAWLLARGLTTLFIDSSDENNPYRMLVVTIGYAGIAAVIWGAVLLALYGGD